MRTGIKIEGVQTFVKLIEKYLNSFHEDNKCKTVMSKCDASGVAGWRKQDVRPGSDYSIEILKSEARKAALIGVFRFKLEIYQTAVCQTKEEAQGLTDFMITSEIHRHTYAFERGKWVLKEREHATTEAPEHYIICTSGNMCAEKWY